MCVVRKPTCCHARLRRRSRAAGRGEPSHWCTWSSWASTLPCSTSCTPCPANKPLMRLMTRVRSCFAVVSSRGSCRGSSQSPGELPAAFPVPPGPPHAAPHLPLPCHVTQQHREELVDIEPIGLRPAL